MSGEMSHLSQIKILVSQYIEDDVMIISPKTCEKLRSWYGDSIKLNRDKLHDCHHELIEQSKEVDGE